MTDRRDGPRERPDGKADQYPAAQHSANYCGIPRPHRGPHAESQTSQRRVAYETRDQGFGLGGFVAICMIRYTLVTAAAIPMTKPMNVSQGLVPSH